MEYQLKEEVVNRLEQIIESIDVILERNKDITSIEDYLSTPWGMTLLDANLMRIQFIGETASAIDKKTDKSLLDTLETNIRYEKLYFSPICRYRSGYGSCCYQKASESFKDNCTTDNSRFKITYCFISNPPP